MPQHHSIGLGTAALGKYTPYTSHSNLSEAESYWYIFFSCRYVRDPSSMAAALLSPVSLVPANGNISGHMTGHMIAGGSEGTINRGVDQEKQAPPEIQITKM